MEESREAVDNRWKEIKTAISTGVSRDKIINPLKSGYDKASKNLKKIAKSVPENAPSLSDIREQFEELIPPQLEESIKSSFIGKNKIEMRGFVSSCKFQRMAINGKNKLLCICCFEKVVGIYEVQSNHEWALKFVFSSAFPFSSNYCLSRGSSMFLVLFESANQVATGDKRLQIVSISSSEVTFELSLPSHSCVDFNSTHFVVFCQNKFILYKFTFLDGSLSLLEETQLIDDTFSVNQSGFCLGDHILAFTVEDGTTASTQRTPISNKYSADFSNEEALKALSVKTAKKVKSSFNYLYSKYKDIQEVEDGTRGRKKSFEYYPHFETASETESQKTPPENKLPRESKRMAIKLYQLDPFKEHGSIPIPFDLSSSEEISCLTFDSSGSLLAIAFKFHPNVLILNVATKQPMYSLFRGIASLRVTEIKFSAFSDYVAVVTARGTIHLFAIARQGGHIGVYSHRVLNDDKLLLVNTINDRNSQKDLFIKLKPVGRLYNLRSNFSKGQAQEIHEDDKEMLLEEVENNVESTPFKANDMNSVTCAFDEDFILCFHSDQSISTNLMVPKIDTSRRYFSLSFKKTRKQSIEPPQAMDKAIWEDDEIPSLEKTVTVSHYELQPTVSDDLTAGLTFFRFPDSEKSSNLKLYLFDTDAVAKKITNNSDSTTGLDIAMKSASEFISRHPPSSQDVESSVITFEMEIEEGESNEACRNPSFLV